MKTLSALKVSSTAKSVKIKLTKKLSSPCLTFEIDLVDNCFNFWCIDSIVQMVLALRF